MSEHTCNKEEVLCDFRNRLEKLETNDREDYGGRKVLEQTIAMLSESIKELSKTTAETSQTLIKINSNMDLMNSEIKSTNTRIDKLENKFSVSEADNTIKIMPMIKNVLLKVIFPTSAIGFFLYEICKSLKLIK
jgi:uncharacterized coiled-coil protein SlyX